MIRRQPAPLALARLQALPHSAARIVQDVLQSAMANAVHNNKLKVEDLVVSRAIVGNAGMLKRVRAVSRGRAHPIKKKMAHVTVFVAEKSVKREVH